MSRNTIAAVTLRNIFVALTFVTFAGCRNETVDGQPAPIAEPVAAAPSQSEIAPQVINAPLPAQHSRQTIPRAIAEEDWFADVTDQSGVQFAYQDGNEAGFYATIEQLGGGVAMIDFDQDDDVDLFFTGGGRLNGPPISIEGRPSALFRNNGRGEFENVTDQAGLAGDDLYTHGVTVGDFDNDGWPDLFVAGYSGCQLLRNNRGQFLDVTPESGLENAGWNTTAVWADFDADGLLDLYVVTYSDWYPDADRVCTVEHPDGPMRDSCTPQTFPGQLDRVWRNKGNGVFEEKTAAANLSGARRGLGVVAADFDEDGWMDLFVVNDVDDNELYYGGPDFAWEPRGLLAGCAVSLDGSREGSMGVDFGDFNGDGKIDLFYTNYALQNNSLLQHTGNRAYLNATEIAGLAGESARWVGWGTGFADFNNDGWQDLFVSNGHVMYAGREGPYFQPAQLFRNSAGKRFEEVSQIGGPYFSVPHAGRGAAVGDINNDGALDLVVVHQNDPVALLQNRLVPAHWIRVKLIGTTSNRDAIGAKVSIAYGDRTLTRWVRGGGGYLSHFDSRIVFPRLDDAAATVTVRWPSGTIELFDDLPQGKTCELTEGLGRRH